MKIKHIIIAFLMLVCIFPLVACDSTGARNNLVKEIQAFCSAQQASPSPYLNNVSYSPEINTKKNDATSEYYTLKYYEQLINLSFIFPKEYYKTFLITPKDAPTNASSLCNDVTKKLQKFNETLESFQESYNDFIQKAETHLDDRIGLDNLKYFKQEYANLVYTANDFNQAFVKAYLALYKANENIVNETLITDYALEYYAKTIDCYILCTLKEYNGIHPITTYSTEYLTALATLQTSIVNAVPTTNSYANWKAIKTSFDNEISKFESSLKFVDLTKDNTNADEKTTLYINKINTFMTSSATMFLQETTKLFSNQ